MSTSDNKLLTTALAQLRSDDVTIQNRSVETVVQVGASAVSMLLPLLDEGPTVRAQVMYALSQIAVPQAAQAFQDGVRDSDERVRAYAATGLARINHPDALEACLKTLDDAPDQLHLDMTPAVHALGEMGVRAVPGLLDLLMNRNSITRLHAQRALELIVSRRHGFRPGQGFPRPEAEAASLCELKENGNYNYSDDAEKRAAAVAGWHIWLAGLAE